MKKNTAFVFVITVFIIGMWLITHALHQDATKITTWIQMLSGVGMLAIPFYLLERAIQIIVNAATTKEAPEQGLKQGPKYAIAEEPKKARIYLVAKVTGLQPKDVRSKYETYKKLLNEQGYEGVAPTDHVNPNSDWHSAMKVCIPLLISCDYYMTIGDPHNSAGATIEVTIAEWLQIPRAIIDEPTVAGQKAELIKEAYKN